MNARQALTGDPHWIDGLATLSGLRDRDRLAMSLAEVVQDLVRTSEVQVWRVAGQGDDQRWLPQVRLRPGEPPATAGLAALEWHALQALSQRPRWPAGLGSAPDIQPEAASGCCSLFELGTAGARLGALLVCTPAPLSGGDERLVRGVLRMYENVLGLLDYGERDELTGLLNRKTFDENFLRRTRAVSLAASAAESLGAERRERQGMQTWLGVIDIDHFKRVNDTHGHLIGDEVLLLVARLMRESFRLDDQLYRFGGEEFVALLRCGDPQQAHTAFERMRQCVQSHAFPRVGSISVSIGFTEVRPGDTPSAAFERADQAVYHAKQNGRNQVHDHAALVAAGLLRDEQHDGGVELF